MSVRTHGSVKKAGGTHVTVHGVCVWGGDDDACGLPPALRRGLHAPQRTAPPLHRGGTAAGPLQGRHAAGPVLAAAEALGQPASALAAAGPKATWGCSYTRAQQQQTAAPHDTSRGKRPQGRVIDQLTRARSGRSAGKQRDSRGTNMHCRRPSGHAQRSLTKPHNSTNIAHTHTHRGTPLPLTPR